MTKVFEKQWHTGMQSFCCSTKFRSWGMSATTEHLGTAYLCLLEDSSSFSVSEWHSSFSFSITWFWDWIMPSSSATVWTEMGPQQLTQLWDWIMPSSPATVWNEMGPQLLICAYNGQVYIYPISKVVYLMTLHELLRLYSSQWEKIGR